MLLYSQTYEIGLEEVDTARIRVTPQRQFHKLKEPDQHVLGITIRYVDSEIEKLIFEPVLNRNKDSKVPMKDKFNSTKIYVPMQPDFVERKFIYKYYGSSDVMKGIGGIMNIIKGVMV